MSLTAKQRRGLALSDIESLRQIDSQIDVLKVKAKDLSKQRAGVLARLLEGRKIPIEGTTILIPKSNPILKGMRRGIVKVSEEKALTYILKEKNLNGLQIKATKAISEALPANLFESEMSAITWKAL